MQSNGRHGDAYNTVQRKEINTALATGKAEPLVEPKATMKPISGPPVYYPPGKEMFTKSEEQAAWRAGVKYFDAFIDTYYFAYANAVIISRFRAVTQTLAANTNTNRRVSRRVRAKPAEPWCLYVCHFAVPCHVRLCK